MRVRIYNGASLHIDRPHPRQKHLIGCQGGYRSSCILYMQVTSLIAIIIYYYYVNILIQNLPMSLFLLSTAQVLLAWGQRSAYIWLTYSTYLLLALMSSHNTFIVYVSGKVLREVKVHLYEQCVAVLSAHAFAADLTLHHILHTPCKTNANGVGFTAQYQ